MWQRGPMRGSWGHGTSRGGDILPHAPGGTVPSATALQEHLYLQFLTEIQVMPGVVSA